MGWVKKRILTIIMVVSLALSLTVSTPVGVCASQDYLSITLADIIIAWYNASGVAIGDSEIVNAIYSLYGSITLSDLADHDCLVADDLVIQPNTPEMRAYVKELIGYGNLTVPMIQVNVRKLQQYLGEIPMGNAAKESLEAMFGWEGNLYNELMFGLLGSVIGSVANIGKIGYDIAVEAISEVPDFVKSTFMGKKLYDIYRHFTNTTYFQDLLEEGIPAPGGGETPGGGEGELKLNFDSGTYAGTAGIGNYSRFFCLRVPEHVYAYIDYSGNRTSFYVYNNSGKSQMYEYAQGSYDSSTNTITPITSWNNRDLTVGELDHFSSQAAGTVPGVIVGGYALQDDSVPWRDNSAIIAYCKAHDPWDSAPTNLPGITKYINNAVGNILSDNYLNLSPNIGNDEYMYIFDRPTYIETLNQITNNTDNGDYSQNSTIINNYNTEYVQPPDIVPSRPTSAPAPTGQPVQPTVSPRPTQIPEEVSNIIYEGGISEEITKKFPFCIPWDIKAMIDRLWAPDRRAPYIHWDATFGSWGKLGEVDIDLSDFDNAAAIFRSTTLLLWIVGLVVITKHLIG